MDSMGDLISSIPGKYLARGAAGLGTIALGLAAADWVDEHRYLEAWELWDTSIRPYDSESREDDDKRLERRYAMESRTSHVANVNDMQSTYTLKLKSFGDDAVPMMRLIEIHDEDLRGFLHCTVTNVPIHGQNKYIALSYTWGDKKEDRVPIFVSSEEEENQRINVTGNLYDALIQVRKLQRKEPMNYHVWNDYLCIDQGRAEDSIAESRMSKAKRDELKAKRDKAKAEKEKQILAMRSIYYGAEKVFAWLGSTPDTLALIDTLRELQRFRKKRPDMMFELGRMWMKSLNIEPYKLSNYRRRKTGHGQQLLSYVLSPFDPQDIEHQDKLLRKKQTSFLQQVRSMVNQEYWHRVWIIQEVAVAKSVEYYCGPNVLDFDLFTSILEEMELLYPANIHWGFWTHNHRDVLSLQHFRGMKRTGKPVRLLEALRDTSNVSSSRPEDRIYALLGMCYDGEDFIDVQRYNIPLDNIIVGMVQRLLQGRRAGSLDIICLQSARDVSRSDELPPAYLPSWVPDLVSIGLDDFNHRMINYLIEKDRYPESKRRSPKALEEKAWCATRNHCDPQPMFHENLNIFEAKGAIIGTIEVLSQACGLFTNVFRARQTISYGRKKSSQIVEEIFETLTIHKERSPTDDDNCDFDILWEPETLKKFTGDDRHISDWLKVQKRLKFFDKTLEEWSAGIAKTKGKLDHLYNKGRQLVTKSSQEAREDDIVRAFRIVMEDRMRLMLTANGHVGWAHPRAEQDDKVCLLAGCTMPVIIRRRGRRYRREPTYQVIGDAYVCGAMHGEYWPLLEVYPIYLS